MRHDARTATLAVFGLFAGGLLGGAWVGSQAAQHVQDPYEDVDRLVRVLGIIHETYVDEVPSDALVDAAIRGMLGELDPHSSWLTPQTYDEVRERTWGGAAGIGIEVTVGDEGPVVTHVEPGSPAARDGLAVGDTILEVDGQRFADDRDEAVTPDHVAAALVGPRGSTTTLQVRREGADDPLVVTTLRDLTRTPAVTAARVDDHVGYLRLAQFADGAADELAAAMGRITAEGPVSGWVLDLRENPGGLLDEAVAVADLFLEDGMIVSTWGRAAQERREHHATAGAVPDPLVVLVDGRSASAAEIVAGAFQDRGRALLVGTPTYGKGSVQTVYEHRDGSALKLTVGRYYTPSGEPVAPRDGRVPDIVLDRPRPLSANERLRARIEAAELADEERAALLEGLDALPEVRSVQEDGIDWTAAPADRLQADPQLHRAVELAGPEGSAPGLSATTDPERDDRDLP